MAAFLAFGRAEHRQATAADGPPAHEGGFGRPPARRRGRLGLRGQVGRHAPARPVRRRRGDVQDDERPRRHRPLPRAGRAGRGDRVRRRARRRGHRHRRRRASVLRAPPAAHAPDLARPTSGGRRPRSPSQLALFDLLWLDGHDVCPLPWSERRPLLEELVEPAPTWRVPVVHDDGPGLLAIADAQGLEGIVSKRIDSPYLPGQRTTGLAQGEGPPPPGGRRRRVVAGREGAAGAAREPHRRRPRPGRPGQPPPVRRQGRHRLHRRHPRRVRAHCWPRSPSTSCPFDPPPPQHDRPPGPLGPARDRHRGRLRGVDAPTACCATRATSDAGSTRTPPTSSANRPQRKPVEPKPPVPRSARRAIPPQAGTRPHRPAGGRAGRCGRPASPRTARPGRG